MFLFAPNDVGRNRSYVGHAGRVNFLLRAIKGAEVAVFWPVSFALDSGLLWYLLRIQRPSHGIN